MRFTRFIHSHSLAEWFPTWGEFSLGGNLNILGGSLDFEKFMQFVDGFYKSSS